MNTFEKQLRNNFQGGRLTLPAPDSLRGTYDIMSIGHFESWSNASIVLFRVELEVPEPMRRHLPDVTGAKIFADEHTGQLDNVIVRYRSADRRLLSYQYAAVKQLRGVAVVLHGIGEFYLRRSEFSGSS